MLGGRPLVDAGPFESSLLEHTLIGDPIPIAGAEMSPQKSATRQTPSPKNEVPKNDAAVASPANKNPSMSTSPNPMPPGPAGKS